MTREQYTNLVLSTTGNTKLESNQLLIKNPGNHSGYLKQAGCPSQRDRVPTP
jgi:hypothetical protein